MQILLKKKPQTQPKPKTKQGIHYKLCLAIDNITIKEVYISSNQVIQKLYWSSGKLCLKPNTTEHVQSKVTYIFKYIVFLFQYKKIDLDCLLC